jgi:hypothetical protein
VVLSGRGQTDNFGVNFQKMRLVKVRRRDRREGSQEEGETEGRTLCSNSYKLERNLSFLV